MADFTKLTPAGPSRCTVVGGRRYRSPMHSATFRPSVPVRVMMLTSAYAPLLVLLAVLNSFGLPWLRWVFLSLAVVGIVVTVMFLKVAIPARNATVERIYTAKPREGEALKFFASYVVPFFVTATAQPAARWGLLIYLVMISALYLQGDMYFSNPVLASLGYRIFELTREDRGFLLVISRSWHLAPDESVSLVPLGGYIYVQQNGQRLPPRGTDQHAGTSGAKERALQPRVFLHPVRHAGDRAAAILLGGCGAPDLLERLFRLLHPALFCVGEDVLQQRPLLDAADMEPPVVRGLSLGLYACGDAAPRFTSGRLATHFHRRLALSDQWHQHKELNQCLLAN